MSWTGSFAVTTPPLIKRSVNQRRLRLESQASQAGVTVLAVSIPFSLESGTIPSIPSARYPITFTASFQGTSDAAVAALRAALSAGHTVEIDVQGAGDATWEGLEDLLTKATAEGVTSGLVVLCQCCGMDVSPHWALTSVYYS